MRCATCTSCCDRIRGLGSPQAVADAFGGELASSPDFWESRCCSCFRKPLVRRTKRPLRGLPVLP
jgi:hypothetical protein